MSLTWMFDLLSIFSIPRKPIRFAAARFLLPFFLSLFFIVDLPHTAHAFFFFDDPPPAEAPVYVPGPEYVHKPRKRKKPKPPPPASPMEEGKALSNTDLKLNGNRGVIVLGNSDEGLSLSRLDLEGIKISQPNEICHVSLNPMQFSLTSLGRISGVSRYRADYAACPLLIDLLDKSVLISLPEGQDTCEIIESDCQVDPSGLWGPPATSFTPGDIRSFEKTRAKTEIDIRATFQKLLSQIKKDKERTKELAAEQAAFSSTRSEICSSYEREEVHGFCSYAITNARLMAISSEQVDAPAASPSKTSRWHHKHRMKDRLFQ